MEIALPLLRLLHIVFGVFWAGSAFFLAVLRQPRLRALGASIMGPVMQSLVPVLVPAMMGSSLVSMLVRAALALFWSQGQLDNFARSGWGWSMLLGLVAAVAAAVIGFGFNARVAKRMELLGSSIQGRLPTPEEAQEMGRPSQGSLCSCVW